MIIVWKPFEPMFIKRKKSLYRESWMFVTVNQQQALDVIEDFDLGHEYENDLNTDSVLSENPLHMDDFFFVGVERAIGKMIYLLSIYPIITYSFATYNYVTRR